MHYRLFGLTLASELALALPPAGDVPPDVSLTLDGLYSPPPDGESAWYTRRDDRLDVEFQVRDVGCFRVQGGDRITVALAPGAAPARLQTWLFGLVFGGLLHQRGCLVLHASALAVKESALLVCGPSGAGKSTTAAGLLGRGASLVADDVSAVSWLDGSPQVAPAYPHQKLTADTLAALGMAQTDFAPTWPDDAKWIVPRSAGFTERPQPVRSVFILGGEAATVTLEPLSGLAKLAALREQLYRPYLIPALSQSAADASLARFAAFVRVARLSRPRAEFSLAAVLDQIEAFHRAAAPVPTA